MIMQSKSVTRLFGLSLVVVWLLMSLFLGIGCQRQEEVLWVDFTATPTDGASLLTVQFTSRSPANITDWWWFFGDGHSSTEPNPSHTYTGEGYYAVSLVGIRGEKHETSIKEDYILYQSSSEYDI